MAGAAVLAALAPNAFGAAQAEPLRDNAPARVLSMNVCTDQLAMLIAGPGQLLSVSSLALETQTSVMVEEAKAYTINHGQAEEVFLMRPDLVIAGTYTTRAPINLLRRLGFRVEEFAPAASFDAIRTNIRRMGALLGREARAEALVRELDDALEEVRRAPIARQRAALTFANSYTAGAGTLSQAAVEAAGLENIAAEHGVTGTARLPLETLVMSNPDLIVSSNRDLSAPALAGEIFLHPAYRALARDKHFVSVPTKYWVCGGPFTLEAVKILREAGEEPAAVAGRMR